MIGRRLTAVACFVAIAAASAASAQPSAGTRTTPDGERILISKDVGGERWAIAVSLVDGTVTGNVFRPGAEPKFVWCERTGDDASLDPVTFHVQNHGDNNYSLVEVSAGGTALIDMDAWRLASRGLPPLPPSGIVPPKGPMTCVPTQF